jgi:hypothetical protein
MKAKRNSFFPLAAVFIFVITIASCGGPKIGQTVISQPDQYRHIYEANEKVTLKAIALVFNEKIMGSNVIIDQKNKKVQTDYIIQDEWRTKSIATVKKLNWKETEVVLSVITEKKTENGWEMRRLLERDQYNSLFDIIELKIYEEMSKIE